MDIFDKEMYSCVRLDRSRSRTSSQREVRTVRERTSRWLHVRRGEVTRPLEPDARLRPVEAKARLTAHELAANVFAADDVEIEVDGVVQIGQQIEEVGGDRDVVLPFGIADVEDVEDGHLDDFETRAGHVQKQVDRRDDHQHARDLVQEKCLASAAVGIIRVIDERVLVEELVHDQDVDGDDDGQRQQSHEDQPPDIDR